MNITVIPELDFASQEELRLADYEKAKSGKINLYRIIRTKKDDTNENINNDQKESLFGGTTSQGLFGTNNLNHNNNNLFENANNIQGGGLFENNNNQSGGLFGNISSNTKGGFLGNDNNKTEDFFGNSCNNHKGGLFEI